MNSSYANFDQKSKAQLTKIGQNGDAESPSAAIRIEDTQEIQVLQDKCQQLAHVLEMDFEVIERLQYHFASLSATDRSVESLGASLSEGKVQLKRVDRLLQRLDGTIALVFENLIPVPNSC